MKVLNLRLVVEDDTDPELLAVAIGGACEEVLGVADLESDGFGRLTVERDARHAEIFLDDDQQTEIEAIRKALASGRVEGGS